MEYVDMLTQESIPEGRLVLFKDADETFTFDVQSLYIWTQQNKLYTNPYTNKDLPPNVREQIMTHEKCLQVEVNVEVEDKSFILKVDPNITLANLILKIVDTLNGNVVTFDAFDFTLNEKRVYELWSLEVKLGKFQSPYVIKGTVLNQSTHSKVLDELYTRFSSVFKNDHKLRWLYEYIPMVYKY